MKKELLSVIDTLLEILVLYSITSFAGAMPVETSFSYILLFTIMIVTGVLFLSLFYESEQTEHSLLIREGLHCLFVTLLYPYLGVLSFVPLAYRLAARKLHMEKGISLVYGLIYGYVLVQLTGKPVENGLGMAALFALVLLVRNMPQSVFSLFSSLAGVGLLSGSLKSISASPHTAALTVLLFVSSMLSFLLSSLQKEKTLSSLIYIGLGICVSPWIGMIHALNALIIYVALPHMCSSFAFGIRLQHGLRYLFLGIGALIAGLCSANGWITYAGALVSIVSSCIWIA